MNNTPPTAPTDLGALLDYGPWTLRQKLIVFLVAMTVVFDGMDIQMMGFAIPAIAKEWAISRASFAPVLGLGLIGITLGSVMGGLVGDRYGRRVAILLNVMIFGVATLGASFAFSEASLMVLRFIAGLGIGGALPNAATLTAEFTPLKRRPVAITLAIVCVPIGGLIAGLISAQVLVLHSWRLLFVIGGLSPIVLLAFLALWLPESPRFLAKDPLRISELRNVLQSIGRAIPSGASIHQPTNSSSPGKSSPLNLFEPGLARDTTALWMAFFCCLTSVYLAFNWLPSVLNAHGFSLKQASQGLALYNFGGILGALSFGVWISVKGSRTPLLVGAAFSVGSAALIGILMAASTMPRGILFIAVAAHGLFVNAVQTTLYALAADMYATRVRATGVASALAIGRTGGILSAFLGGAVVNLGAPVYFEILAAAMFGVLLALSSMTRHIKLVRE